MGEMPVNPIHVQLFEELNEIEPTQKNLKEVVVFICTPRCGSTLFTERLNSTGLLGRCEEWFNNLYFEVWSEVTGREFRLSDYIPWVVDRAASDVFAIKAHVGQLVHMKKKFGFNAEGKLFYLHRRDKIAQAVSLSKAISSGQYRSYEPGNPPNVGLYDVAHSLSVLASQCIAYEMVWKSRVLAEFAYEDFQNPYDKSYDMVLEAVGKERNGVMTQRVKKQRNNHSLNLGRKFKKWLSGGGAI